MTRTPAALLVAFWLGLALWPTAASAAASPFARWGAVVVAGDKFSAVDTQTEAFDNARRDIVQALLRIGFQRDNIEELSSQPERYAQRGLRLANSAALAAALRDAAAKGPEGCLLYITSHGTPEGVILGDQRTPPEAVAMAVQSACAGKPMIAVVSACYSGVFVPVLAGPNHMVVTAARPDRNSFGCGVSDKYPYFDDCMLTALPTATDFIAVAASTRTCVAAKERAAGLSPPSEPQVSVGGTLRMMLPLMSLGGG